jgi:hypothetical protein
MSTQNQDGSATPIKKKSTSETGHAINVASFKLLLPIVERYGGKYAPANPNLTIDALKKLLVNGQKAIADCNAAETNFDVATDSRADLYKQLRPLSMRAVNSFRSSGVPKSAKEGADTIVHKIQGRPSNIKKKDVLSNGGDAAESISNSQQSYVQLAEHLKSLTDLFVMYPQYAPTEEDLQTAALSSFNNKLNGSTDTINAAISTWNGARQFRNATLYTPETGLVDVALRVKEYVASIYSNTSPEYKEIRKLKFRNIKDR